MINIPENIAAIINEFKGLPQIEAVGVAGSRSGKYSDKNSDYDFYLYINSEVPRDFRRKVGEKYGTGSLEIDNRFFGTGDEWMDKVSGVKIDLNYFEAAWMDEQIEKVLTRYQPSLGYTTCFWYTLLYTDILFDKNGWLARLQTKARVSYPLQLKNNIIAFNHPTLGKIHSSFAHQIELAIERNDMNSVIHRTSAYLASYFDILFAVNELPHPGEKRLLVYAADHCDKLPENFTENTKSVFNSINDGINLINAIKECTDSLSRLLKNEGYII